MPDLKISELPDAGELDNTELLAVVKNGVTSQTTVQAIVDNAVGAFSGAPPTLVATYDDVAAQDCDGQYRDILTPSNTDLASSDAEIGAADGEILFHQTGWYRVTGTASVSIDNSGGTAAYQLLMRLQAGLNAFQNVNVYAGYRPSEAFGSSDPWVCSFDIAVPIFTPEAIMRLQFAAGPLAEAPSSQFTATAQMTVQRLGDA